MITTAYIWTWAAVSIYQFVGHLLRGVVLLRLKLKFQDTIWSVLNWSPILEIAFSDATTTVQLHPHHEYFSTYPLNLYSSFHLGRQPRLWTKYSRNLRWDCKCSLFAVPFNFYSDSRFIDNRLNVIQDDVTSLDDFSGPCGMKKTLADEEGDEVSIRAQSNTSIHDVTSDNLGLD